MFWRRSLSTKLGISALAVAVGVGAAALAGPAHAETPAVDGVLVLRNGSVLSGTVRRYGDAYHIDVAGALLQVPAEQVEMFSRSLEEAYDLRRRDRTGPTAAAHMDLAAWCMQLDLLSQAARELLDARTMDPGNLSLPGMEMRLKQLLELRAAREALVTRDPRTSTTNDATTSASAAAAPIEISAAAQSQFVRSIQPMLIRGCATGGCHQPGSAREFQLDRWALEGNGNAVMVRRNLSAVLGALNAADPASSPLMHWARVEHGRRAGSVSRPLAAHQAALLLEWLNEAAGVAPAEEAAATIAVQQSPPPAEPAEAFDEGFGNDSLAPESTRDTLAPRDAFDPEIFNRRRVAAAPPTDAEVERETTTEPPTAASE
jgi:hypothetical protein